MDTWSGDMRTSRAPSYADTGESMVEERAALIALLQTRPEKMSWPEIAAEVLETGSALEVWHRLVPAMLPGSSGDDDALESAARNLREWASQGCGVITILDGTYPVRLRGIHRARDDSMERGRHRAPVGPRHTVSQGLAPIWLPESDIRSRENRPQATG